MNAHFSHVIKKHAIHGRWAKNVSSFLYMCLLFKMIRTVFAFRNIHNSQTCYVLAMKNEVLDHASQLFFLFSKKLILAK